MVIQLNRLYILYHDKITLKKIIQISENVLKYLLIKEFSWIVCHYNIFVNALIISTFYLFKFVKYLKRISLY